MNFPAYMFFIDIRKACYIITVVDTVFTSESHTTCYEIRFIVGIYSTEWIRKTTLLFY